MSSGWPQPASAGLGLCLDAACASCAIQRADPVLSCAGHVLAPALNVALPPCLTCAISVGPTAAAFWTNTHSCRLWRPPLLLRSGPLLTHSCQTLAGPAATAGVAHLSSLHRLTFLNLWNCLRVTGGLCGHLVFRASLNCRGRQQAAGARRCSARGCHGTWFPSRAGPVWPCMALCVLAMTLVSAPAENGLSVLRHLPLLEDLSLRGCQQLQDGCLAHLAGLTRLARLDMRACEHLRGVVSAGWAATGLGYRSRVCGGGLHGAAKPEVG